VCPTGLDFAFEGEKTTMDTYLAICGCDGTTEDEPGSCSTSGLLIATIVMRFCCFMGIVDRSIVLCCAKGKASTLKTVLMIELPIIMTAFLTGTIMNIRDKHGADAYIQNTVSRSSVSCPSYVPSPSFDGFTLGLCS
jgi:hypothetical protein